MVRAALRSGDHETDRTCFVLSLPGCDIYGHSRSLERLSALVLLYPTVPKFKTPPTGNERSNDSLPAWARSVGPLGEFIGIWQHGNMFKRLLEPQMKSQFVSAESSADQHAFLCLQRGSKGLKPDLSPYESQIQALKA